MDISINQKLLAQVLPHYDCSLSDSTVTTLGNGLINYTYLVKTEQRRFVLQQLNQEVFNNPEQLIQNAELINQHLRVCV